MVRKRLQNSQNSRGFKGWSVAAEAGQGARTVLRPRSHDRWSSQHDLFNPVSPLNGEEGKEMGVESKRTRLHHHLRRRAIDILLEPCSIRPSAQAIPLAALIARRRLLVSYLPTTYWATGNGVTMGMEVRCWRSGRCR